MNIIKGIISFIKRLFSGKDDIKMIEAPVNTIDKEDKNNFINSLKINMVLKSKKKVETLTCFGDGLGIQTKIKY